MSEILFTGFDSAWGGQQGGAFCDLAADSKDERCDLTIRSMEGDVQWPQAVDRVTRVYHATNQHVIAIDQGLIVVNQTGQRPVERMLAQALMNGFQCGAHSSNTSNTSCYGPGAGIWKFLSALEESGYTHNPMAVAERYVGKFYFECYPHPALIGLFNLDAILRYKVRKRNPAAWNRLLTLLTGLGQYTPRLVNVEKYVSLDMAQNKANEDLLDSLIAAYVAAYFWYHGTMKSTMIGCLETGYIVTPHSGLTKGRFDETFPNDQTNQQGLAPVIRATATDEIRRRGDATAANPQAESIVSALDVYADWTGPVTISCSDNLGNLWCNVNDWMQRTHCEGYELAVKLIDEDGEPELTFGPFRNQGVHQGGMRISQNAVERQLWQAITHGATAGNPLEYRGMYRYTGTH